VGLADVTDGTINDGVEKLVGILAGLLLDPSTEPFAGYGGIGKGNVAIFGTQLGALLDHGEEPVFIAATGNPCLVDSLGYDLINGDIAGLCVCGNAGFGVLWLRPGEERRGTAESGCYQKSVKTGAQVHGADPFSNIFPSFGQRSGSALVRVLAVIAVASVLVGLTREGSHTGASSTSDERAFGSAPEDGAENGAARTPDESAFAGTDASLMAVVSVVAAIIVVVVGLVTPCSAVKVVVVLGYRGGREGDQHHEGQCCACDAVCD
jgi:hypothetical protein